MKQGKQTKLSKVVGGILCVTVALPILYGVTVKGDMPKRQGIRGEKVLQQVVEDEAWKKVTSPTIEYITDDSHGVKIFDELVPNKEAYIYEICQGVAKYLYKTPDEVPYFEKLTLKIEDFEGIAWKSGEPPHITVAVSSRYLEEYAKLGVNISEEVKGILFHELTHAYQHSSGQELSAIEGTADLVRYLAGYTPIYKRKAGGTYTDSYNTTGFFFDWIRASYKDEFDFLYEFNQTANPTNKGVWSLDGAIKQVTGRSVDELWKSYQEELIEKGTLCRTSGKGVDEAIAEDVGNLALGKAATASGQVDGEEAEKAIDGKVAGINNGNTKWCQATEGDKWLQVDLGKEETISRWVVRHAGSGGELPLWNTKDFKLQKSEDGKNWTDVDAVTGNAFNVTDRKVEPFKTRYVRLYITTPTNDGNTAARIYEFGVY